ncbi:MAG: hypothetical protein P1U90_17955 [Akkermansiaceae bacterium]|jgi:hypothetical protein|nr:hypothetical protein [Akkermansiaceae bacterium]
MKNTLKFALTAVLLAAAPLASANVADCVKLSKAVKVAVAADSSKVLEIVAANVAANESCACEIVKAAIVASDADKKQVAKIVNTAILEAPSQIRIIAQCAIATAPDAVSNIQAVVEKYDAAGGEGYSEKGGLAKGGLEKGVIPPPSDDGPNPLDYPFESINDPIVKESRWLPEFFFPPIEDDPNVTGPVDNSGSSGGSAGGGNGGSDTGE